ncbi:MAG: ATP-binding cassette domain-containing protein [Candidatus Sericytochromatia bacterium]
MMQIDKLGNLKENESTKKTYKTIYSARNLKKSFLNNSVIKNVSFDIYEGEVILLEGKNGSGKTTLLNILTGNLEPDYGEIIIKTSTKEEKFSFPYKWWKKLNIFNRYTPEKLSWHGISRVWQDVRLFSTMTVLENVCISTPRQTRENPLFALVNLNLNQEKQNIKDSTQLIEQMGLMNRLDSSCDKLSLGQTKRVAIARALKTGAKILFLDEPLSGLDKQGIEEIIKYLKYIVKEHSITLVIVEHVFNIPYIKNFSNTTWHLSNGNLFINPLKINDNLFTIKENKPKSISHIKNLPYRAKKNIKIFNKVYKESFNIFIKNLLEQNNMFIYEKLLDNGAKVTYCRAFDDYEYIFTNLNKFTHLLIFNTEFFSAGILLLIILDKKSILKTLNLSLTKGIRTIFQNFSFDIKDSDFILMEAPNGWGKSTLLDAISGIQQVNSGKIYFKGKEIQNKASYKIFRDGIRYIRSQNSLFMSLSIKEHKKLSKVNNDRFELNIDENKKSSLLSGGQRQKLTLDLIPEGDLYLFDEPLIGLDSDSIKIFFDLLKELMSMNKTIIITVPILSKERN